MRKNKLLRIPVFLFAVWLQLCCPATLVYGLEYNDDTAGSYSSRYGLTEDDGADEDQSVGPGVTQAAASVVADEETKTDLGPMIHEVTLGEQYHEDFDLYELSLDNQFFLFSNVSNGGVTDRAVYVDIPEGLIYTVEKDGVVMPYSSRQQLGEKGTYVMRFTAVYDLNVPLAEQEEYRAVFRFRIDERVVVPEDSEEIPDPGTLAGLDQEVWLEYGEGLDGTGAIETAPQTDGDDGNEAADGIDAEESRAGENSAANTAAAGDETAPDPGSIALAEGEAADPSQAGNTPSRTQTFHPETSMYQVTLEDGFRFESSVPEGMITIQPVRLTMEPEAAVALYLNEEAIPCQEAMELAEFGTYRLVSGEYEFRFQITDTYVNTDEYRLPDSLAFKEVRFQDQVIETPASTSLTMEEDGQYLITAIGSWGELYTMTLNRDTIAPEAAVTVGQQQADITYQSDDIDGITLAKDGGAAQPFAGTLVDKPGTYVLAVSDRAGNVTSREFTLNYHMNVYALTAIIVVAAGTTAGVVILIRKKKNLTFR